MVPKLLVNQYCNNRYLSFCKVLIVTFFTSNGFYHLSDSLSVENLCGDDFTWWFAFISLGKVLKHWKHLGFNWLPEWIVLCEADVATTMPYRIGKPKERWNEALQLLFCGPARLFGGRPTWLSLLSSFLPLSLILSSFGATAALQTNPSPLSQSKTDGRNRSFWLIKAC